MKNILEYFPHEKPREGQIKCLEFIQKSVENGIRDIVIAAPTGIGKSAIGIAASYWADKNFTSKENIKGAYYLITQKLLQDQLERDCSRFKEPFNDGVLLKSAIEYPCPEFDNCAIPAQVKKICTCKKKGTCAYVLQKQKFLSATLGVTNYAYYLTETTFAKSLVPRKVMILDEAHNIENVIMDFVDATVNSNDIKEWLKDEKEKTPEVANLKQYVDFLDWYIPKLDNIVALLSEVEELSEAESKFILELDTTRTKLRRAKDYIEKDPNSWIFWIDKNERNPENGINYIARPLSAAPYLNLLTDGADLRIYMSAYPGVKEIFCKNLGLDKNKVAWISLGSTFSLENRKIFSLPVGSMGSRCKEVTLPRILATTKKIVEKFPETKGLIHCVSYEIGEKVVDYLSNNGFNNRLIYPKNADEREECFKKHEQSKNSIIISPSMVEGYDFKDDLARWQIILKIGWPYLGNKQIAARMEKDYDWYLMKTVMYMVQACGRIVRSDEDYGLTYILDSDFKTLYGRASHMFPKWFTNSIIWK